MFIMIILPNIQSIIKNLKVLILKIHNKYSLIANLDVNYTIKNIENTYYLLIS